MDLKDGGFDAGGWIDLAQDRVQRRAYVRAVMNLRFLKSQLNNKSVALQPRRATVCSTEVVAARWQTGGFVVSKALILQPFFQFY